MKIYKYKFNDGFLLIQFLMYLLMSGSMFCMVSYWIFYTTKKYIGYQKKNIRQLTRLTITDCFSQDIMGAPSATAAWIEINDHCIMWQTKESIIGYKWHKNKLVRIVGTYNITMQRVEKQFSSCIAQHITNCYFTCIQEDGFMRSVKIHFAIGKKGCNTYEYSHQTSIRNK